MKLKGSNFDPIKIAKKMKQKNDCAFEAFRARIFLFLDLMFSLFSFLIQF